MNENLVNKENIQEAGKVYQHSQEWVNYAIRLPDNLFVRRYLYTAQKHICPWCNKKLRNIQEKNLHHISYLYECRTTRFSTSNRTDSHGQKFTQKYPPCQTCSKKYPDKFQECMSHVVLVHRECNQAIQQEHIKRYEPRKRIQPSIIHPPKKVLRFSGSKPIEECPPIRCLIPKTDVKNELRLIIDEACRERKTFASFVRYLKIYEVDYVLEGDQNKFVMSPEMFQKMTNHPPDNEKQCSEYGASLGEKYTHVSLINRFSK